GGQSPEFQVPTPCDRPRRGGSLDRWFVRRFGHRATERAKEARPERSAPPVRSPSDRTSEGTSCETVCAACSVTERPNERRKRGRSRLRRRFGRPATDGAHEARQERSAPPVQSPGDRRSEGSEAEAVCADGSVTERSNERRNELRGGSCGWRGDTG